MDYELVVIKHCESIVCDQVPDLCPMCGKTVNYEAIPAPSYYPSPFLNGHHRKQALSLLVKPTEGVWSSACKLNNDLHIGITDDSSMVISYGYDGVERETVGWEQSLVVYQVSILDSPLWEQIWTNILHRMEYDTSWSRECYDENGHNCFDFVLEFLHMFFDELRERCAYDGQAGFDFLFNVKEREGQRLAFIEKYVTERMEEAVEFIVIEDNIKKHGYATPT